MIILIGGSGCVGKSVMATRLAERLNLPSVVGTDVIHEMMMSIDGGDGGNGIDGGDQMRRQYGNEWRYYCGNSSTDVEII
jgi:dephospho-CoA kinase